jgi:hypothetical protein
VASIHSHMKQCLWEWVQKDSTTISPEQCLNATHGSSKSKMAVNCISVFLDANITPNETIMEHLWEQYSRCRKYG